jgi:hypothetical protein
MAFNMNQAQLTAMQQALRHELVRLDAITVSCLSCKAWKPSRCTKFDAVPPVDVQKTGCDEWEFDNIPF